MGTIYTKEGRPLRQSGSDLFSRSGTHVARLRGGEAFGPDGAYVGTLVDGRLVYRSTHSARIAAPFAQRAHAGIAVANRAGSAKWGEEPPIPD
jgi:hypothetical protein